MVRMKKTVHSADASTALGAVHVERNQEIDEQENRADHADEQQQDAEVMADMAY